MADKKIILIVEDDKLLSDLLLRKLGNSYEVSHATTGEDALKMLKDEKPALVLLDILLPGMDGFEVLRSIKGSPTTKDVPVVILSNLGQESDIKKGKELGAEKFLVKVTLTLDDIVREIEGLLGDR